MTLLRALALASLLLAPLPAGARVEPAPTQRTAFSSGTSVASVLGVTTEQNLTSVPIPPLGRNGMVRVTAFYSYPTSANAKTLLIRLGTAAGATSGFILLNNGQTTTLTAQAQVLFWNAGSTGSQVKYASNVVLPYASASFAPSTAALDGTSTLFVNFNTTTASATEQVTLVGYLVEIFPGS